MMEINITYVNFATNTFNKVYLTLSSVLKVTSLITMNTHASKNDICNAKLIISPRLLCPEITKVNKILTALLLVERLS